MRRAAALTLAVLAVLPACHPTAPEPSDIAFKSDTITLPTETATFSASAAIVTQHCVACHSPELILTQPALKPEVWQAEIAKMRTAYHASIGPKDDKALVAALLELQNKRFTRRRGGAESAEKNAQIPRAGDIAFDASVDRLT